MDPGPIRAQSLKVLNKCSGSTSWTTYTRREHAEPRAVSGAWAVSSLDKAHGTSMKINVCAPKEAPPLTHSDPSTIHILRIGAQIQVEREQVVICK